MSYRRIFPIKMLIVNVKGDTAKPAFSWSEEVLGFLDFQVSGLRKEAKEGGGATFAPQPTLRASLLRPICGAASEGAPCQPPEKWLLCILTAESKA